MERAREACLRLLAYRARSRRELSDRLRHKGFAQPTISAALQQLEAGGLINDAEFARSWVRQRTANNPRGARALRWELRAKGVEEQTIRRALAQEMGGEQELEAALKVAARYEPRAGEQEVAVRARLVSALRRRGFAPEVMEAVLARRRG